MTTETALATAPAALETPEAALALVPVAAIVHAAHVAVDALLAGFAADLGQRGWRVRGVVQQSRGAGKAHTFLVDLDDGSTWPLFQKLGAGSRACSVDPAAIAAASVALRRALHEGADLVCANRFGALEASGGGFAAEMLALMSEGRPLLTTVADDCLQDWREFTGGYGAELPPTPLALKAWFATIATPREPS